MPPPQAVRSGEASVSSGPTRGAHGEHVGAGSRDLPQVRMFKRLFHQKLVSCFLPAFLLKWEGLAFLPHRWRN